MKKANGRYMNVVCDRCGCDIRVDDTSRALLHGWGWRKDTGDLCPGCYSDYRKMISEFKSEKRKNR